jgi:hypothetical protein
VISSPSGGDDGGVEDVLVVDLAADVFGPLDDAVDRGAVDRVGLLAQELEHLLQAFEVTHRLFQSASRPCFNCALVALSILSGNDSTILFAAQ